MDLRSSVLETAQTACALRQLYYFTIISSGNWEKLLEVDMYAETLLLTFQISHIIGI